MRQPENPSVLIDQEAGERYQYVLKTAREEFEGTNILDSTKEITPEDIEGIMRYHRKVSPVNPANPWRVTSQTGKSQANGEIVDPSSFANWELPGGPLEHIELAGKAAEIIVNLIQHHLKPVKQVDQIWAIDAVQQIKGINPLHAEAAAMLHDEGREVTHTFLTTDFIGNALLRRIGVRDDIREVLTGEEIMQVPSEESMDEVIQHLPAEAVIIRIADEFGKRFPGTNRLYLPEDYDAWDRMKWADGYIKRPLSGRASDKEMREMMPLHVDNVPRYFEALDNWIKGISSLSLSEVTQAVNQELSPQIPPLK